MKPRLLVVYALCLLVPALSLGAGAWVLLRREAAQMEARAVETARQEALLVAERMALAVAEAEDALGDQFTPLRPPDREAALLDLERRNPLVRNTFVWSADQGLLWPPPEDTGSRERVRFRERFAALFAGELPWDGDHVLAPDLAEPADRSARLAPRALRAYAEAPAGAPVRAFTDSWMPWLHENRLHILGWAGDPTAEVWGVELEVMALLARLIEALPLQAAEGETWDLVDGAGRVLHRVGVDPEPEAAPQTSALISPRLPHWRIAWYRAPGIAPGSQGLMATGALVLALLLAVLGLGGALLLRLAWASQREALRKTTFVSNVSHELKTPLTTIRMYAEILEEGRIRDEARRRSYLETIGHESRRLARLVNNVLDFSRLEQGRKRYRPEPLDLAEAVREVVSRETPRLQAAGLRVEGLDGALPCPVRVDRDALEQILLNLLDNAVKYAGAGRRLEISLDQTGGRARLRVRDHGPGIPAAHRAKVFESFHRVDDTLTTRTPGSGLGLSIARRLARDLGGDLEFDAPPGGGARFTFTLPLEPGASA